MPAHPRMPKNTRIGRALGTIASRPTLNREEHQRHHEEDHQQGERQALDLPGDDVGAGAGEQHEVAGRMDPKVRRKVVLDVVADAVEGGLDLARAGEVRAHDDVAAREVRRDDAAEGAGAGGDMASTGRRFAGSSQNDLGPAGTRCPSASTIRSPSPPLVEALLQQLQVVDDRDRCRDAGQRVEKGLQVLDLLQHLPALRAFRAPIPR